MGIFPHSRRGVLLIWLSLTVLAAVQAWYVLGLTGNLRPGIETMPPPPSQRALSAIALGDREFLFRYLGRWLQGVGDGGGRMKPLREYNYDDVVGWLQALDEYDDHKSEYIHFLAAQYFGQVNIDHARVRKIVDYLRTVGLSDPARHWPWLVWAARTARRPLDDRELVKSIAHDLQSPELNDPSVPPWVRFLPVRLYRAAGDEADSRAALAAMSPADINFMAEQKRKLDEAIQRSGMGDTE